jgi:siroheme synthase-like protein
VAERKVADLLEAGASVHVVAKEPTTALGELAAVGDIALEVRAFEERDIDGTWLVVAATADEAVQRHVAEVCDRVRVFCVAVDDPKNATAYGGSVLRRGNMTVAISTSGESPAVARLFRELLEQALPDESWLDAARALREKWKTERTPMTSRFAELVRAFRHRASEENAQPGSKSSPPASKRDSRR